MAQVQQQHEGEEIQQIAARVPAELHRRLRIHAAERGESISKIITELLDKAIPQAPKRR